MLVSVAQAIDNNVYVLYLLYSIFRSRVTLVGATVINGPYYLPACFNSFLVNSFLIISVVLALT
jgi:hypothetical protein